MKSKTLTLAIFLSFSIGLTAQSTNLRVFDIFQEKCVSCHGHNAPQSNLDLQGAGINIDAQLADVYDNIVNVTPDNDFAEGKGYKYIYPGRPDLSYLFRINCLHSSYR